MIPVPIPEDSIKKVDNMLKGLLKADFVVERTRAASGMFYTLHHTDKQGTPYRSFSLEYAIFVYLPRLMGMKHIMYFSDELDVHVVELYGYFLETVVFSQKSEKLCQKTENERKSSEKNETTFPLDSKCS